MGRRKNSQGQRPPEHLPAWERVLRHHDWKTITGKEAEKDFLLLVWRESSDRNLFFMIPRDRIPADWGWDLHAIDGLYMDLETEDGQGDDLTRLLGLIYCSVNTVAKLKTIQYRGDAWPVSAITGMWGKYLVPGDQLDRSRIGLVVCTGTVAPPDNEES